MGNIERSLVSIQEIKELNVHSNAERLELATILGWTVVVKKGEFSVGEKVVYFSVDSMLPIQPQYEFLRSNCYVPRLDRFRIKTIRLRGEISQGLALPLSSLDLPFTVWEEGQDVTELLGVVKYEPLIPANMVGVTKGGFPSFIAKTDEVRLQSVPWVLEKYKDTLFYATEKLDGTSATYFVRDGVFGICSRNLLLDEEGGSVYCEIAKKYNLKEKMLDYGANFAIQGEIIGPGIQKNKYNLTEPELRLFSLQWVDEMKFGGIHELIFMVGKLELKLVPIIQADFSLLPSVEEMVHYSIAKSFLSDTQREGVVFRSMDLIEDNRLGGIVSFKVINPEFLLKFEKEEN
jgi:RNA ligase (TIGR02306 family)